MESEFVMSRRDFKEKLESIFARGYQAAKHDYDQEKTACHDENRAEKLIEELCFLFYGEEIVI